MRLLSSRFFRRLFLPYLALICVSIAAMGVFGALRLRSTYLQSTREQLLGQEKLLWTLVRPDVHRDQIQDVNQILKSLEPRLNARVTIAAQDGRVLADNEADASKMENHATRPELLEAAEHGTGSSIRHSDTIHQDLLYLAVREADGPPALSQSAEVRQPEEIAPKTYFVRLAVPLSALQTQLHILYAGVAGVALMAMGTAAALGFYLARQHTEPVRELAEFAGALSRGELQRRILLPGSGEIGILTQSLNTMAESLNAMINQTTRDRAELAAIVASMNDGVIATDARQRIVLANHKAAELLDIPVAGTVDRPLWEVVRLEPILKAATEALAHLEPDTFPVSPSVGRHLEVTVRCFPPEGVPDGLVIVAHDTTRSVRYQELRKEFVANVSHELRTPLTVIKGFTETLQDGALHDPIRGPAFLNTITRHVDQLTNLVNDLLELSRLEGSPELPRPVGVDIGLVTRKVIDLLMPAAQKKNHTLRLSAPAYLPRILGNPDYLERAAANLVDNAIKYTQEGGTILVTISSDEQYISVEVADNGIGIPADDIPRVFERFYRVDRSRSREMGGTGLGLSIVKHVAQVHGGRIDVSSTPGVGTWFRLTLPIPSE